MKIFNKSLLLVSALFASNYALANCTTKPGKPNTEKFEMRGEMPSSVLTQSLKQGDLVNTFTATFMVDKSYTVDCTDGSTVLFKMQRALTTATEYKGAVPVPHAYYITRLASGERDPNSPTNDWIYTVQTLDGEFFYNTRAGGDGRPVVVPASRDYKPRQLIISLYAGKDNPTTPLTFGPAGQNSFMAHIQLNNESPTDNEGIIYYLTGTITPHRLSILVVLVRVQRICLSI